MRARRALKDPDNTAARAHERIILSSRPMPEPEQLTPWPTVRTPRLVSWKSWRRSVREQLRCDIDRKVSQWKEEEIKGSMYDLKEAFG